MTTLAIDIGNTSTKSGIFQDGELVEVISSSPESLGTALDGLLAKYSVSATIISSVRDYDAKIAEKLRANGPCLLFNHRTTIPLTNRYETPETLGLDRLAVAAGGYALNPGKNVLVIDAGTCITYDFVNREGEYLGGGISPGLTMRLKALNDYTGRLPKVTLRPHQNLVGHTTEESILSGVVNGAIAEIEGMIERYGEQYNQLDVILTGGDAEIFETNLKSDIFAISHLVLKGLNQILAHNEAY